MVSHLTTVTLSVALLVMLYVSCDGYPQGKPEGVGKPKGVGKPDGVGKGKPEGVGKPDSVGKPDGVGKGKPEGVGKPSGKDKRSIPEEELVRNKRAMNAMMDTATGAMGKMKEKAMDIAKKGMEAAGKVAEAAKGMAKSMMS